MTRPVISAPSYSILRLAPGEELMRQGDPGGDLYVLEQGELVVERDGVAIAEISRPDSLVGEMSVVLGTPASATVRARRDSTVHVYADARRHLQSDPELTFRIAYLMASRLDTTSALLAEHTRTHGGKPEQDLWGRIVSALHLPVDESRYVPVARRDMFGASGDQGE